MLAPDQITAENTAKAVPAPVAHTEFAAAKINLALHVLGRRLDGYHALDSIVAFADVGDRLQFSWASQTELTIDGDFAAGLSKGPDNLIMRAHDALLEVMTIGPVHMQLTKNLPVASGIGGGSADAAAALRGLLHLSGKTLPRAMLSEIALSLGADVPVCLAGQASRMSGIGEHVQPFTKLPWLGIVMVNPLQPCSTSEVFRHLSLAKGQIHGSGLDPERPETWRNDLTAAALKTLPLIGEILAALQRLDRLTHVRMSGSGATCFGLASSFADAQAAATSLRKKYPNWWIAAASLH